MTALATIYKKKSIIMAADSMMPRISDCDTPATTLTQKLFLISKLQIGISAIGHATHNDKSVNEILYDFSTTVGQCSSDCYTLAKSLARYLEDHHAEMHIDFNVCGFDGNLPVVAEIERVDAGKWRTKRVNSYGDGILVENIWALCDEKTILDVAAATPDFSDMTTLDALDFIDWFFKQEISNVSSKRHPDVGGPVDVLVLTPERNFFVKAKDLSLAVI